ncbi:MAG: N-acetylmuramoyl-L-alanine amidase family protein, partial [Clostridium sp.]|uniref:N-acetylmuramoyl-L-alanine amidase family protein n=1 Tax=Clostridium sp. TaxID=1506 RepID=UPI003EE4D9BA
MNRKRLNTIIKATTILIAVSVGSIFGGIIDAEATTKNLEQELISVVNEYGDEEVVIEDGISLRKGEKLDLSKYKGWKVSNESILSLENGVATPKNTGTVFLSNKIGNKVHIIEVYVPSSNATYVQPNNTKVDRNYYKVFIDPGHGGYDNGAEGNGLYEDNLTLQISQKVKKLLVDRGIEVKMSRENDTFVGLGERAEMANAYGADLYVSPHINSFTSASANGIETYYHRDKGAYKPLSDNIQSNAIKETGAYNRGVKNANFAVLRESKMPSSLFEAGFISNPQEAAKMAT